MRVGFVRVRTRVAAVAAIAFAWSFSLPALANATNPSQSEVSAPIDGVLMSRSEAHNVAAEVSKQRKDFGGIYYNDASKSYIVTVTTEQGRNELERLVLVHSKPMQDSGTRFAIRLREVKRSLVELDAVASRIANNYGRFGSEVRDDLVHWGFDAENNVISVGVSQVNDRLLDAARSTYGDSVRLREAKRPSIAVRIEKVDHVVRVASADLEKIYSPNAVPNRLQDFKPYYAGDRIGQIRDGFVWQCTSGTVNNSVTFMFTAGHCFPSGTNVEQGWYDPARRTWFWTGLWGQVGRVEFGNDRIDWEEVNPALTNPPGENTMARVVYTGQDLLNPTQRTLTTQTNSPVQGEGVYADGSFTGESGHAAVTSINTCVNADDNQGHIVRICGQAFATASNSAARLINHGDSGGPVLNWDERGHVVGTITAGNVNGGPGNSMYFTQMGSICDVFGSTC